MNSRDRHMFQMAVLGVRPDTSATHKRFTPQDFRLALLQIGAPVPRYHRRSGCIDTAHLDRRIDYVRRMTDFCMRHFGTIGAHGSFVPHFIETFEVWFTQCVKELEHGEQDN